MLVASFEEKEVVATLNLLLLARSLHEDPTTGFKNLAIPAWMKDGMPSFGWQYSSSLPLINWAILEALYPAELPALARAKGFAGLQLLAREALEKDGDGGAILLDVAVQARSVEVTDMLLKEGFPLELLPTELGPFDKATDQPLKTYLEAHGRKFPAAK